MVSFTLHMSSALALLCILPNLVEGVSLPLSHPREDYLLAQNGSFGVNISKVWTDPFTKFPKPSSTNSSENAPKVACNGRTFGTNLNLLSCMKALQKLSDVAAGVQLWFAMRDGPQSLSASEWLPKQWLSPDGRCSVELFLEAPDQIAYVSYAEIYAAAQSVFHDCNEIEHSGGIASDIGLDIGVPKPLAVVLQASDPTSVRCNDDETNPAADSCKILLDLDMPAGLKKQMFAFSGFPGAEVKLPAVFHSSGLGCWITTRSPDWNPDYGRWYDIWKAASLVWSVCVVAKSAAGSLGGQGELGHLEVVFSEQSLPGDSLTSKL